MLLKKCVVAASVREIVLVRQCAVVVTGTWSCPMSGVLVWFGETAQGGATRMKVQSKICAESLDNESRGVRQV